MTFTIPHWTSPLAMACDLDPSMKRTPALEIINRKLVEAYRTPRAKLLLSIPPQEGKGLALDTPLATPEGWTTMGDLEVGATLFDSEGRTCRVTDAFPVRQLDCYEVELIDGSKVTVDGDHLWKVQDRNSRRYSTVDTRTIAKRPRHYSVPTNPVLDLPDREDLPIHPYALGAWLGDGTSNGAGFTTADEFMAEELARVGHPIRKMSATYAYTFGVVERGRKDGMFRRLRLMGLLSNKHIPVKYLRAGYEQRLALLQGLMDTDGSCYYTSSDYSQCEFCTTSPALAQDFRTLARSLGLRTRTAERRATLNGEDQGPKWVTKFTTDVPVFRLPRKLDRLYSNEGPRKTFAVMGIKSVTPVESVPTRCIKVDSSDHTFLAGKDLIPTHNSTLCGRWFLIWALWMNRKLRVAFASYDVGLARTIQGQTRDTLNTYGDRLGLSLSPSFKAKQEWVLIEGGGVLAVGIGTGFTGRPADLLVIDDPFKGAAEAASPTMRENVKLWWQSVASARLAPGAPVIVIQTRWNEDDLIGWLYSQQEGEQWEYLNIPAQADHDPNKGETDVLGREPGEYMVSARGRTKEEWDQRKINAGARQWAAMYQGRPSPAEGSILKRAWWERNYYRDIPWVLRSDGTRVVVDETAELIITVDCAFKGEDNRRVTGNRPQKDRDYVSMQVWMRRGVHIYLLDQVHGHMDFVETSQALLNLAAQWPQATLKVVEEAANGPAVMAALRNQLGGIVGEIPQGSKESRANATAPYLEAGNIHLPDPAVEGMAWVADFVEEAASFPYAKHDDRVDTYTMAVNRLLIQPLEGEVPDMRSEEERWYDAGFSSISQW